MVFTTLKLCNPHFTPLKLKKIIRSFPYPKHLKPFIYPPKKSLDVRVYIPSSIAEVNIEGKISTFVAAVGETFFFGPTLISSTQKHTKTQTTHTHTHTHKLRAHLSLNKNSCKTAKKNILFD